MGKHAFLNLIKNNKMRQILSSLPYVSFLLSSLIVFGTLNIFIKFNFKTALLVFVIGLFIVALVTHTELFIKFKTKHKQSNNKKDKKSDFNSNLGILNSLIIIFKLVFFNIFNDLFILLLIWTVYLAGVIGILNLIMPLLNMTQQYMLSFFLRDVDYKSLMSVLTILGIFGGFFQFYIKYQRRIITEKIQHSFSNYIKKNISNVTFQSFLKYMSENSNGKKDLLNRIKKIMFDRVEKPNNKKPHLRDINNINLSFNMNQMLLFQYLEMYGEFGNDSSLNKSMLIESYKNYFDMEYKKFKKELNKENFDELKKMIFSGIFFFEEIVSDLYSSDLNMFDLDKTPSSFQDFYSEYAIKCTSYMMDDIIMMK